MVRESVYIIDLFCGAGGVTSGAHLAGAEVIVCVNHDKNAIKSHEANHPSAIHFEEDVRDLNVVEKIRKLIELKREAEPNALFILWASLECTNFSNAKGGLPRDADSRALAECMPTYIEAINPDMFIVENVREFLSWGPLDKNGKPVSRTAGKDFVRWYKNIQSYGYDAEHVILNAADYGAYTARRRLFIQFSRVGISWPKKTHSKKIDGLFGTSLKKWKPVRDVLDLEDRGRSILTREKPLVEATLSRVYAGMEKFINEGAFLQTYYKSGSVTSVSTPAPTVTTKDRIACVFIDQQFGTGTPRSIDLPASVLTTCPKLNTVQAEFIVNPQYDSKGASINRPAPTLIARMDKSPLSLATAESGHSPAVLDTDSPMMIKIKIFMAEYGLCDIKMRMLKIIELKKIQGFSPDYVLLGTQADQKKFLGNAVEVTQARALFEGICDQIKIQQGEVS